MKLVAFLIVFHSLAYFAGSAGMIAHQTGETNTHKEFVTTFDDNSTAQVDVQNQDASIFDQIRITAQAIPFIGFIAEMYTAPFILIESTGLPDLFVMLLEALLGFFQGASLVSFIRGYDF